MSRNFRPLLIIAGFAFSCSSPNSTPSGEITMTVPDAGEFVPDGTVAVADAATPPPQREFAPEPARYHRLTRTQYLNTLKDLFGTGINLPENLEVDTFTYGFTSISASAATISPRTAELFEVAAQDVAKQVIESESLRQKVVGCEPVASSDDCAENFIRTFGRLAWRRPLDAGEVSRWLAVYRSVRDTFNNPLKGVEFTLGGLLQSPHFLFRAEVGQLVEGEQDKYRYSDLEMASRLSFLIWQSTPDDILIRAAEEGKLSTRADIEQQARRLLSDARAKSGLSHFFREYLKLDRLEVLTQDPDTFPQVTETLGVSMRSEILMLAEDIIFGNSADIRTLFRAPYSYVNRELARLYNLTDEITGESFKKVEWSSNSPRTGILTSGAFLALNAHSNVTSPTLRGRFVRQFLLCQDIAPPPPGVVTTLPEGHNENQTLRERLEELHLKDEQCAGCHSLMDPIGFAFENFDSVGAYRTTENGLPVDASGQLDGKPFQNARDLSMMIAEHPRFAQCLTLMAFRHASGHLETKEEEVSLLDVYNAFIDSGYDFQELVLAVVLSDAFRFVKGME